MKESLEDFKRHLPQYLSADAQTDLFAALDQFPDNIDARLYTINLRNAPTIFQGDGLPNLLVTDLPNTKIGTARVMILSNSCDMSRANQKAIPPRLIYCPLISLPKLITRLESSVTSKAFDIAAYLANVRRQRISSMFYLPKTDTLDDECVALLDRIDNCDAQSVDLDEMVRTRLFTLSDYGFYLFLFKLSVHLTRVRENVVRS
jgi:hypothetical protein